MIDTCSMPRPTLFVVILALCTTTTTYAALLRGGPPCIRGCLTPQDGDAILRGIAPIVFTELEEVPSHIPQPTPPITGVVDTQTSFKYEVIMYNQFPYLLEEWQNDYSWLGSPAYMTFYNKSQTVSPDFSPFEVVVQNPTKEPKSKYYTYTLLMGTVRYYNGYVTAAFIQASALSTIVPQDPTPAQLEEVSKVF